MSAKLSSTKKISRNLGEENKMHRLKHLVVGFLVCWFLSFYNPAVVRAEADPGTNDQKVADLAVLIHQLQAQVNAQNQRILELESRGPATPGMPNVSIAQLSKDVELLKRQREVDQEVQLKKEKEAPLVIVGKEGFSMKSRDSDFQIKIKGQIQSDGRFYVNDGTPAASNTFLVRKARPILEGTVFRYFDFKLMPDFGNGQNQLVDAYVDVKYWTQASLKTGKFKGPIGLERLQSDSVNLFPELSLASNLVPNRDVGIDLHGELWDGIANYDLGVFNGSVDNGSNDFDNHDDKDFMGRVFFQPFKNNRRDWLNGLGLGFAGSVGTSHSSTLPQYKTFGQQTFFQYASTTSAAGKRFRLAPQFYYYFGSFGLLGEFVQSTQDLRNNGASPGTSAFKNNAGQLVASYVVTGENASYNGVIPRSNFDPRKGTWGALELVSRVDWLNADKENLRRFANLSSSAQRATGWGVGFNWYLNKNLKFSTGFEETFFDAGGLTTYGTKNRPVENAFISRMQVVF